MQALAKLDEVVPDVIIMDVDMPHMDGYQLCKLVRGAAMTKDVPVIMLTGKDGFIDKVRAKMAGCAAFVAKPFEPAALVQAVESQIRMFTKR
jgi:twitching motility two-component system response regulator PilG